MGSEMGRKDQRSGSPLSGSPLAAAAMLILVRSCSHTCAALSSSEPAYASVDRLPARFTVVHSRRAPALRRSRPSRALISRSCETDRLKDSMFPLCWLADSPGAFPAARGSPFAFGMPYI